MRAYRAALLAAGLATLMGGCGGGAGAGSNSGDSGPGSGGPAPFSVLLAGKPGTFETPAFVAVDKSGTVYTTDFELDAVFKTPVGGPTVLLAGTPGVAGVRDGIATQARFFQPQGIAVDEIGNVYVADSGNHAVRKITPQGTVSTLAGTPGISGFTDGPGRGAQFAFPIGVALGAQGELYVVDSGNKAIRIVDTGGTVTTVPYSSFPFDSARGIAISSAGDIWIADGLWAVGLHADGSSIRVVPTPLDANAIGVAIAQDGSVYLSGAPRHSSFPTGKIYRLDTSDPQGWAWSTVAGSDTAGLIDGPATSASFRQIWGLAVDSAGGLVIADAGNGAVRILGTNGLVAPLAGTDVTRGFADGNGGSALFSYPWGIAHSPGGLLYVTDLYNNAVRQVSTNGDVQTFANEGPDAPILTNTMLNPTGITFAGDTMWVLSSNANNYTGANMTNVSTMGPHADKPSTIFVEENYGTFQYIAGGIDGSVYMSLFQAVYKWPVALASLPFVGSGTYSGAPPSPLSDPRGMVVDSKGNLYIVDTAASQVLKVTPDGSLSEFAGQFATYGHADGQGTDAQFFAPYQLAIDDSDNIYVLHKGPVRKIAPGGAVSTLNLEWGTPHLHSLTIMNGRAYGVTSNSIIQARLP